MVIKFWVLILSSNTTKDFGPIRADYTFFEDYSTESVEDVRAYAPHVLALKETNQSIHMLDFGCGEGRFSVQFLEKIGLPSDRLWLSLVEPDDVYRQQARERLLPWSTHPVNAWQELPSGLEACFNLVLSNHVLYYVPNLDEVVAALIRALAPNGIFLAAIAGQSNLLIQFWNRCFGLLGQPVPYHTAEDFEVVLDRQQIGYRKEKVNYELVFPDSEENRLTMARFLLGSYFCEVPAQPMLEFFNPYAVSGKITMPTWHDHFVIGSA